MLVDGKWKNKRTNSFPAVFHFNGGGKQHHLDMESSMWYKRSEYNTKEATEKLSSQLLNVPTQPGGVMRFGEICKNYFRI